tara:strand:- start:33 stop:200 length:168 start_codon:yes stop_codon:yes gene_type:complete
MLSTWICTDEKTIRAGNKKLGIWWNVESLDQAAALIKVLANFNDSQLIAMFRGGI